MITSVLSIYKKKLTTFFSSTAKQLEKEDNKTPSQKKLATVGCY